MGWYGMVWDGMVLVLQRGSREREREAEGGYRFVLRNVCLGRSISFCFILFNFHPGPAAVGR